MSALEQLSIVPLPSRHATRALSLSAQEATDRRGPFAALSRLAGRLLPGAILVFDRGTPGGLRIWPSGVMGRRQSIDRLAAELMRQVAGASELWVERLSDHDLLADMEAVAGAGPLAFACVPLPGHVGTAIGVLREEGPWTMDEQDLLRDLACAFSTECDRDRLRAHTEALIEESSRALHERAPEPMASVAPLLTGVCHELNNPLTSIKSFAELLLLDARSDEDREALQIVQREAHRAARIVGDLRMVARQSAEATSHRELVDLNAVVERVVESRGREIRLEGIRVDRQTDPALLPVRAVRAHLEQAVSHLLSHAIESFSGRGGAREITIATGNTARGIRLTVRDTGRGMTAENIERLFDPFTGGSQRHGADGFQLGLSLVQSIVANHGGRVVARSRIERGTVVHIDLPLETEVGGDLFPADEPPAERGLRILIADEEEAARFSVSRYLERRGHTVEQTASGEAALEMIAEADYDVILADVALRVPGGLPLREHVRAQGVEVEGRMILMTASPDEEGAVPISSDLVPLLRKPFELAEVAQVVESHAMLLAG